MVRITVYGPGETGFFIAKLPESMPPALIEHVRTEAINPAGAALRSARQALAPAYPEPEKVTVEPGPPLGGDNTKVDVTSNWEVVESP
jgi:hypothetical protein